MRKKSKEELIYADLYADLKHLLGTIIEMSIGVRENKIDVMDFMMRVSWLAEEIKVKYKYKRYGKKKKK